MSTAILKSISKPASLATQPPKSAFGATYTLNFSEFDEFEAENTAETTEDTAESHGVLDQGPFGIGEIPEISSGISLPPSTTASVDTRLHVDATGLSAPETPENAPENAIAGNRMADGSSVADGAVIANVDVLPGGMTAAGPESGDPLPLVDGIGGVGAGIAAGVAAGVAHGMAAGAAMGDVVASIQSVAKSTPATTGGPSLPRDSAIQEKWSKVFAVEKQIVDQGEVVLAQCVAVAHLDKKVKDARKELKEATEDLIKLQGELVEAKEDLDEARETADREWRSVPDTRTRHAADMTGESGESRTANDLRRADWIAGSAQVPGLLSEAMAAAVTSPLLVDIASTENGASHTANTVRKSRMVTPPDPAITTDLWVLKSKEWAGGATNAQIEKLNGEDVRTVANLEEYMRMGSLVPGRVKGIGQSAVDKISDALMAWRKKNPVPEPVEIVETVEPAEPPSLADVLIAESLDVPVGDLVAAMDPANDVPDTAAVTVTDAATVPDVATPDIPAPVMDDIDTQIKAAYTAGCEAAIADRPVATNPFERGTQLWTAWEEGFKEANV